MCWRIVDRTFERLAPSDVMITRVRRMLIKAATDHAADGSVPVSVERGDLYAGVRGGQIVAANGVDAQTLTTLRARLSTQLPWVPNAQLFIEGEQDLKDRLETQTGIPYVSALGSAVGMVFQDYTLFPHMSVLDNICLAPVRAPRSCQAPACSRPCGVWVWQTVGPGVCA